MLHNNTIFDTVNGLIDQLHAGNHANKQNYVESFNQHLLSILNYYLFKNPEDKKSFRFTEQTYFGLEQQIIQNLPVDESPIDWEKIDEFRYMFKSKLKSFFGQQVNSEYMKPFVLYSTNLFEDWLLFRFQNPHKPNPWEMLVHDTITQNGCMLFVSDNKDKLISYKDTIYKKVEMESYGNLGVIAKPNTGKYNISGFVVDNRYSTAVLVRDYLHVYAKGIDNAMKIVSILNYLYEVTSKKYTSIYLKNNILIPFKRNGLIGSCNKGYFWINSIEDLVITYQHHLNSLKGINLTLEKCKNKAKEFNVDDLDTWIVNKNQS